MATTSHGSEKKKKTNKQTNERRNKRQPQPKSMPLLDEKKALGKTNTSRGSSSVTVIFKIKLQKETIR